MSGLLMIPDELSFSEDDETHLLAKATGWTVLSAPAEVLDRIKFVTDDTDGPVKVVRLDAAADVFAQLMREISE